MCACGNPYIPTKYLQMIMRVMTTVFVLLALSAGTAVYGQLIVPDEFFGDAKGIYTLQIDHPEEYGIIYNSSTNRLEGSIQVGGGGKEVEVRTTIFFTNQAIEIKTNQAIRISGYVVYEPEYYPDPSNADDTISGFYAVMAGPYWSPFWWLICLDGNAGDVIAINQTGGKERKDFNSDDEYNAYVQEYIRNSFSAIAFDRGEISALANLRMKKYRNFLRNNIHITKKTQTSDDSGIAIDQPWVKVVGGIAALAVAMTLIAKIFKARRKKSAGKPNQPEPKKANKQQKEKKKKEEEKFIYILQLNKDVLEIGPEKSDKLVVTVWQVDSAGNRALVKDATIQVSTAEPNLTLSSTSGNGQCVTALSLKSSGQFKEAVINIKAVAGGNALQASAKVICEQQLTLIVDGPTPLTFINGKKFQEALFEQPFYLWFTDDPNPTIDPDRTKPVAPPFKPVFKLQATPPILVFDAPVNHGDNIWKVGVGLDSNANIGDKWLFEDGKISVSIEVTAI
jgi:hypothetical protein